MTRPKTDNYEPRESDIAIAFVEYIGFNYPKLRPLLIKIDNEGKTSWRLGKQKKREGKAKGASDYFFSKPKLTHLFHVDGGHEEIFWQHGLWLELKTKSGRESPEQKAFGDMVVKEGYAYKCCYGLDEAIDAFEHYIK